MENVVFIYYLHKGDNIPFYVGKTIDPFERLSEHKREKHPDSVLEIIDEVSEEDYIFWESHYISLFKSWGFILENKNDGGGGCPHHTKESKLLISEKNKGWVPSKEMRISVGKAAKQRWNDNKEELSKKISENRKGIKHKNHTKGSNHKGTGRKLSEETKQKIGNAHKGGATHTQPHTEETKNKLRMKKIGSKATQETKEKKSIAMKAYWERRKNGK
jgi:hypothetical protein